MSRVHARRIRFTYPLLGRKGSQACTCTSTSSSLFFSNYSAFNASFQAAQNFHHVTRPAAFVRPHLRLQPSSSSTSRLSLVVERGDHCLAFSTWSVPCRRSPPSRQIEGELAFRRTCPRRRTTKLGSVRPTKRLPFDIPRQASRIIPLNFSSIRIIYHILGEKRLMLPPPGLEPSLLNATSTLLEATIATATSLASTAIDVPTITQAAAAIAATALSLSAPKNDPDADNGECRLLGPFAIFVQGALGLAALLALVFKRWRERPQRPLKIWFFDASKQVVGSILVHMANLLMSMLSSGQLNITVAPSTVTLHAIQGRMTDADGNYSPNPCSFYLLNLAIDASRPRLFNYETITNE